MSTLSLDFGGLAEGTPLQSLLMADCIVPGATPGYQLCKIIYEHHAHGAKIVDFPLQMAQSQERQITVPKAPDDGEMLVEAFKAEWLSLRWDRNILNLGRQARIYGVSTLGLLVEGRPPNEEVDYKSLSRATIGINVWDPLNTAGSLVLSQDPNALDYQKPLGVSVNGVMYHRSRTVVLMNEDPLYISYTSSGFGFLGRSVYQRALVSLQSFVYCQLTLKMVAIKAGLLIAKMKSQSSAVDGPMAFLFGVKRNMLKEAQTGQVLSIDAEESIESLDLTNLAPTLESARKSIIEDEAAASGTPAKIVLAETYAEGFGEGTEDAKAIAQYIEGMRTWLNPAYAFADQITMYRAWNEDFFETAKVRYPDRYEGYSYAAFFQEAKNSFTATWPSLLTEPQSEVLKGEDVVLKAIIAVVEVLLPAMDPTNKAAVVEFMASNINERKKLFTSPLELDYDALAAYQPPTPLKEPDAAPPESQRDSAVSRLREVVGPEKIAEVDAVVRRVAALLPTGRVAA